VQRLNTAITEALADQDVQNGMKKLAAEPMPLTPAKFDNFINREIETNAALVKAAGIKPN
jgi:tripartite-type tricarboxylate transporter receptor subunit TctC